MEKTVVTLCTWVVVHDIQISLGIILVHLIVPVHCIQTSYYSSVNDRQFPVFSVIYLSCSRQYDGEPYRTLRVWCPCRPVALIFHRFTIIRQFQTVLSRQLQIVTGQHTSVLHVGTVTYDNGSCAVFCRFMFLGTDI